jgi:hypothetical protein
MSKQQNPRHHVSQVSWEFEYSDERGNPEVYYITEMWGPGKEYRVDDIYSYSTREPHPDHLSKVRSAFQRMVEKVR